MACQPMRESLGAVLGSGGSGCSSWYLSWRVGGAAEHLVLSSRAWPRRALLDELLHDAGVPVVAWGGEALRCQWQSLGGPPFAVLRLAAAAAAPGRPLPLGSVRDPQVASSAAAGATRRSWSAPMLPRA